MLDFFGEIIAEIFMNLIMDNFYLNKRINILIRIIFTLPITIVAGILGVISYDAFVKHEGILNVVIIAVIALVILWGNIVLIKKILKNQKEDTNESRKHS